MYSTVGSVLRLVTSTGRNVDNSNGGGQLLIRVENNQMPGDN